MTRAVGILAYGSLIDDPCEEMAGATIRTTAKFSRNPKRARLLATLAATSRSLSDADLETAVELVGALGRRRKR